MTTMHAGEACPISRGSVDHHVVRAVATQVVLIAVAGIATRSWWIFGILAFDFLLRGFSAGVLSPLKLVARTIVISVLHLEPRPENALPKRFAARVGFVLCSAAAVLFAVGQTVPGLAVAIVMCVCALAEAALGYCVGCKVYALLPPRFAEWVAR